MRSDAIDQLLSNYLKMPARVSWKGAIGDSVRGVFEEGRLELSGVSVLALPCDRIVVESDRFQFTPGVPARIEVAAPRVEISIDQNQLDRWVRRTRAPLGLNLEAEGIETLIDLAGFPISRTLTTLEIRRGWLRLTPIEAQFMGLENRFAKLFRGFLPIPRLAPQTRLSAIRHSHGSIQFELGLEDFEEAITPGLIERLTARFLPFARRPDPPAR